MFGILNLNKPAGATSRDVVNRVQRLVRPHKVGHAGTLDPLATGVLVICVGPATRLVEFVQRMPKRYTATFLLGCRSDTEDVDGNVEQLRDAAPPTRDELEQTLPNFRGRIEQRPPAYSALKVDGRRAYKLARSGENVKLAPRPVEIHSLEVVAYDYPRLTLDVSCGSGTYVRSLGRDIAHSLRTGAVTAELQRTEIGGFHVDDAVSPDELSREDVDRQLLPPRLAAANLPQLQLSGEQIARISAGLSIPAPGRLEGSHIAALDADERLVAILTPRGDDALGPVRNFVAGS